MLHGLVLLPSDSFLLKAADASFPGWLQLPGLERPSLWGTVSSLKTEIQLGINDMLGNVYSTHSNVLPSHLFPPLPIRRTLWLTAFHTLKQ